MSNLPPGLKDFGARLTKAAEGEIRERQRPPTRRRLRSLGLPVTAALLAAAVSAGAVKLVDPAGEPIKPESSGGEGLQSASDPAVVVGSAAEDPGGGPPWVVRAYTNASGLECVQVGRLRDGVFGQVQGGQFRAMPNSAPGTCATATARGPLIAVRRVTSRRTLVFGLAASREPVIVRAGDRRQRVVPTGLGAFVAVFANLSPNQKIEVRSTVAGRTDIQRFS